MCMTLAVIFCFNSREILEVKVNMTLLATTVKRIQSREQSHTNGTAEPTFTQFTKFETNPFHRLTTHSHDTVNTCTMGRKTKMIT